VKPAEASLNPPGISALKASTPGEAAARIRAAFPDAEGLQEAARFIGSTSASKIRAARFDVIPNPTRKLPNHHRVIHHDGAAGFRDDNLRQLAEAFTNTVGH
jgi:hypothetical protein